MLNKKNPNNTIRIILILLFLTTGQADACLERVKKWWAKPAKKSAVTRTTAVLLPTADNPFPPEITLIVLDYLKKTEESMYVHRDKITKEIEHIGICDSERTMHIIADPRTWVFPSRKVQVRRVKKPSDLVALCSLMRERHDSVVKTYRGKLPCTNILLGARAAAFRKFASDFASDSVWFSLVERHDATQQTTERFFFFPGPEELYLEKESRKGLLSCCRKTRGRIMIQEENKED
jgi:hypothetical protein